MGSPKVVKLYHRIGEVARLLDVETHVLRYWESEFRSLRPEKSKSGQRVYSQRDVETLRQIKHLLRDKGFTIAGARRALREPESESPNERDVRAERDRMRSALLLVRTELATALAELGAEPMPGVGARSGAARARAGSAGVEALTEVGLSPGARSQEATESAVHASPRDGLAAEVEGAAQDREGAGPARWLGAAPAPGEDASPALRPPAPASSVRQPLLRGGGSPPRPSTGPRDRSWPKE